MTCISGPLSPYISRLLSAQEHFCDIFVSESKIITRRLNVREETWGFVGKNLRRSLYSNVLYGVLTVGPRWRKEKNGKKWKKWKILLFHTTSMAAMTSRAIKLYSMHKMVLTFESLSEILKCDHSSESDWAVLSFDAFCFSLLCQMKLGYLFWIFFGGCRRRAGLQNLKVSKCLTKHMYWFYFGIFVELMSFACFTFKKDILHENKDRTGGAKGSEKRKKYWKNDTYERWWRCVKSPT